MDKIIYYEIKNKGKNEFIYTNLEKLNTIIEDAKKYYNLKKKMKGLEIITSFKTGDFVLYLLSHDISFDSETNIKINFIKQFLEDCIINNSHFTTPIFLAFVRDVLQIPELKYTLEYYSDNYYTNINLSQGINKKNIKTKLSIFENNKKNININKTYICDGIVMFILISLFEIINSNTKIHKCINCGKIFINNSKNTNTRYCNYLSPQDKNKTCFNYRKSVKFQEVRKHDKIFKIHNDIFGLLDKRVERAKDKALEDDDILVKECEDILYDFNLWYKKTFKEYKNGNLSKEQFVKLLEELHAKYKEEKHGCSGNRKKQKI